VGQTEHLVTDVLTGQEFACRDGETLLEAAIRSGTGLIRVGCRAGGCGMCKVRVVGGHYEAGKMSRAHVSGEEEQQGHVLACRTFPRGVLEILRRNPSGDAQQSVEGKMA
jgi:ferredoxin